jgi:hypothetical protein
MSPFDWFAQVRRGTYEEARSWVGRKSAARVCENVVDWSQIKAYCAAIEDANPIYWDESVARDLRGGITAPPGMLLVWLMELPWRPGGPRAASSFALEVPLPGDTLINVSTESEFFAPIRLADQLHVQEEVESISSEKRTTLGVGHFITTLTVFWNQHGERVATNRNVLFRFRADREGTRP